MILVTIHVLLIGKLARIQTALLLHCGRNRLSLVKLIKSLIIWVIFLFQALTIKLLNKILLLDETVHTSCVVLYLKLWNILFSKLGLVFQRN